MQADPLDPSRVYELFCEIVELEEIERTRRLEALAAQDAALAAEINTLIAADVRAAEVLDVFEQPPRPSPEAFRPGYRFRDYRIIRRLGRGGMGDVWLAADENLRRSVALKVLPFYVETDGRARLQLLEEARAIAALSHPHVAAVHEAGDTPDGRPYIAMAYLEGPTLRQRIEQGRVPAAEALRIGHEVAMALEAAHAVGIAHHDVKPENVILTSRGAQVIDFGLARAAATGLRRSRGTLPYQSPESLHESDYDGANADRWALGVMLVEMLTGCHPFRGDSPEATRQNIVATKPAAPGTASYRMPAVCERLVSRMLARDPGERFSDTGALVSALAAALALSGERSGSQLSMPTAGFIGREQQLWQIADLLRNNRLLTLTGTGGTGKTRLAVEVALRIGREFPGGVHMVPLAALTVAEDVPSAITRALGIPEIAGRSLEERVAAAVGADETLIILDNFEHLLEAAALVPRLLHAAPSLRVLATSRAALRVGHEVEYTVPPMTRPAEKVAAGQAGRFEAVALFVARARDIRPEFSLTEESAEHIAEICRRLDGLPLAIELAAARVKVLSPAEIVARLRDRFSLLKTDRRDAPARHRALSEAIAWSYDLLSVDEKRIFRILSVFSGGCTLEAVEAVSGLEAERLIDSISALVEHSLIVRADGTGSRPRFSMLETIRAFGTERLEEAGESAGARRAHLAYFTSLVARLAPQLQGSDQAAALAALDREHPNLKSALDAAADDPPVEASLTQQLSPFWLMRGHLREGSDRVRRVLKGNAVSAHQRAELLTAAGTYAHNIGAYSEARSRFEEALELHERNGNEAGLAVVLNHLGWVAWRLADYPAAVDLSGRALELHRSAGNQTGVATSLNNLGWTAQYSGRIGEALHHFEQALDIRTRLDNRRAHAFARASFAAVLSQSGRHDEAHRLLTDTATFFEEVGDRQLLAFTRNLIAGLHFACDRPRVASELLTEECIPAFRAIGDGWGVATALARLGSGLALDGDFHRATDLLSESLAQRKNISDRHGVADAHSRLGEVCRMMGDEEGMLHHFRTALHLLDQIGSVDCAPVILENLALAAEASRHLAVVSALLDAADRLRERSGAVRPPVQKRLLATLHDLRASADRGQPVGYSGSFLIPEVLPFVRDGEPSRSL